MLTSHLCPSTSSQSQAYKVVAPFVPCDGDFNPTDANYLHQIEKDLDLPPHSISATSWIKKPKLRAPNQRMANIKIMCSSATAANKMLTEHILIANSHVVISKDILELIRCNKCQLYGHICTNCPNDKHCANCAKDHSTSACPTPRDLSCISCGATSRHTSSDCNNCPHFTDQAAKLDMRIPENSMPLFPILNQLWTFTLAPRNNTTRPANTFPAPTSLDIPPSAQRLCTQKMLQNARKFILPVCPHPLLPSHHDQGWKTAPTRNREHARAPFPSSSNAIKLPQPPQSPQPHPFLSNTLNTHIYHTTSPTQAIAGNDSTPLTFGAVTSLYLATKCP